MTHGNDAAMPTDIWYESRNGGFHQEGTRPGLTKREYFAVMAMQGLLASGATYQGQTTRRDLVAMDALFHADALIEVLNKEADK